MGLLLALLAGALVSIQNIFNTKVNERGGAWSTTTLVLGMGFLASMLINVMVNGSHAVQMPHMQPWYWISGLIGVGVVICLMQGMKLLGPTYAISIVLTAQLGFALLWDSMGWLGLNKVPFSLNQLLGVLIIVGGIVVFKMSGKRKKDLTQPVQGQNNS